MVELSIQGVSVSEGIAIGTLYYHRSNEEEVPKFSINQNQIDAEILRYRNSLSLSLRELNSLEVFLGGEKEDEAKQIVKAHMQMLKDPIVTTVVEHKIRASLLNAEYVFQQTMREYEKQFINEVEVDFFQQRLLDIKDLSRRVLSNLWQQGKRLGIPEDSIVYAKELMPSDVLHVSKDHVKAIITQEGGITSHVAVIAKSRGIPYVTHVTLEENMDSSTVIVDGGDGYVVVNPSPESIKRCTKTTTVLEKNALLALLDNNTSSITLDGHVVEVWANLESLSDIEEVKRLEIAGVGLFRTEFFAIGNTPFLFDEEAQEAIYRQTLEGVGTGVPVVFRVFDIGGDKQLQQCRLHNLGERRAIRYLLHQKTIFCTQIRALLKAAKDTDLHVLLPFVCNLEEIFAAREIIRQMQGELVAQNQKAAKVVRVGSMIELPAAAMIADQIAGNSDFLSIGTNDLIQYALALHRSQTDTHGAAHLGVIRMIAHVIKHAKEQGVSTSLCGEIAADPAFTELLVGLGLTRLSCAPRYVSRIREAVRKISLKEAQNKAQEALGARGSTYLRHLLTN